MGLKSNKGIVFISLILFFIPNVLFAYHVLNERIGSSFVFNKWTFTPQDFRVDSGTLAGGNGFQVVTNACNEWNGVEGVKQLCGDLNPIGVDITIDNFLDLISLSDGINDIVFDETGEILAFFGLPPNVLGIGLTVTDDFTGRMEDALLVLNGLFASSPNADQLSTTVHELGHIWGLAHSLVGGINSMFVFPSGLEPIDSVAIPTMYPFANPLNDEFGRTLEQDDIASARLLYPGN